MASLVLSSRRARSDSGSAYDFEGFTKQEIYRVKIINEYKINSLINRYDLPLISGEENSFIGFGGLEIKRAKVTNAKRINILQGVQKIDNINAVLNIRILSKEISVRKSTNTKRNKKRSAS